MRTTCTVWEKELTIWDGERGEGQFVNVTIRKIFIGCKGARVLLACKHPAIYSADSVVRMTFWSDLRDRLGLIAATQDAIPGGLPSSYLSYVERFEQIWSRWVRQAQLLAHVVADTMIRHDVAQCSRTRSTGVRIHWLWLCALHSTCQRGPVYD